MKITESMQPNRKSIMLEIMRRICRTVVILRRGRHALNYQEISFNNKFRFLHPKKSSKRAKMKNILNNNILNIF